MATTEPPKPTKVKYDPAGDTFTGTMLLVVRLAMKAVSAIGWRVTDVRETIGFVTFETGVVGGSSTSGTISIEEVSENAFRVSVTGKVNPRGGQLVFYDIGNFSQRRVQKLIAKMKELAGDSPSMSSASQPEQQPAPCESQNKRKNVILATWLAILVPVFGSLYSSATAFIVAFVSFFVGGLCMWVNVEIGLVVMGIGWVTSIVFAVRDVIKDNAKLSAKAKSD